MGWEETKSEFYHEVGLFSWRFEDLNSLWVYGFQLCILEQSCSKHGPFNLNWVD